MVPGPADPGHAAAIRAHAAVLRERGAVPESFVVPLPVNVRPRGAAGALFRTRVSILWFQVLPEHTETLPGLVEELKSQRHALIKQGAVENGIAAMAMSRYAPMALYARIVLLRVYGRVRAGRFEPLRGAYRERLPRAVSPRLAWEWHDPVSARGAFERGPGASAGCRK